MMSPLGVLPFQLACQILLTQNYSSLVNVNVNLGIPSPKSATELPGGYTVFPDIGVAYKYYKNPLTWNAARRYCVVYGGNVAIIDSFEKIEHVRSINTGNTNVYVGIHRLYDGAEWTEIKNDSPVISLPWRTAAYETDLTRQCMGLVVGPDPGLFATKCIDRLSFVCEVPIFKN